MSSKYYLFNLYYMKGNDIALGNFLSRRKVDEYNSHEIIPISLGLKAVL